MKTRSVWPTSYCGFFKSSMALTEREVFKEQVGKKMMSQVCHLSANSADLFSKHALFPLKVSPLEPISTGTDQRRKCRVSEPFPAQKGLFLAVGHSWLGRDPGISWGCQARRGTAPLPHGSGQEPEDRIAVLSLNKCVAALVIMDKKISSPLYLQTSHPLCVYVFTASGARNSMRKQ